MTWATGPPNVHVMNVELHTVNVRNTYTYCVKYSPFAVKTSTAKSSVFIVKTANCTCMSVLLIRGLPVRSYVYHVSSYNGVFSTAACNYNMQAHLRSGPRIDSAMNWLTLEAHNTSSCIKPSTPHVAKLSIWTWYINVQCIVKRDFGVICSLSDTVSVCVLACQCDVSRYLSVMTWSIAQQTVSDEDRKHADRSVNQSIAKNIHFIINFIELVFVATCNVLL